MRQIDTYMLAVNARFKKKDAEFLKELATKVFLPSMCDKDNESVINSYIDYCRLANYADGTLELYRREINLLSKFFTDDLVNLTHIEIKKYIENCKNRCKARTVAHKLSIINAFYKYLLMEEWIQVNPCLKVPRMKVPSEQKTGITDLELAKAMRYIDNDRDIAVIEFLKATGCRISEVCKLNVSDIDFKNRTAFIRQAKGKKDRIVSFDARCEKYLKIYLKPFYKREPDEPFFLQKARGGNYHDLQYLYVEKRITTTALKQMFAKIQEVSGIKAFHAHAFRHYCITKLLRKRMPLKLVSLQAGHASSSTTLDIYDDITLDEMQEEYAKVMC